MFGFLGLQRLVRTALMFTFVVVELTIDSSSVLSFLLLAGAWDNAQVWTSLTAAQRSSIKSQYAAAGIKLMVSAFGSTDVPTSSGVDPIATANTMAAWVKQYSLDGIDVDYEVCLEDRYPHCYSLTSFTSRTSMP